MNIRFRVGQTLFAAGALFAATTSSHAALITWGAPTNISGDSDVSTAGTLVDAFNLGHNASSVGGSDVMPTTVNGVTFNTFVIDPLFEPSETVGNYTLEAVAPAVLTGAFNLARDLPFSAAYQLLLESAAGSLDGATTLTMGGLTVGRTYAFQWWAHSGFLGDPTEFTTATAGGSVTLDWNTTDLSGGAGQFAIGTFTADNATQVITFTSPSPVVLINAFQLRQLPVSVPEPGTAALMLVGLVALRLAGPIKLWWQRFFRPSRPDAGESGPPPR